MARGLRKWSKTAATNANADSGINWAEGMAPSAVNDSARAEMASMSMWRDDNNGTLSGTLSTATYSVTSNEGFDAYAAGDTIAFQIGSDMPATALLNVDALGAKPLRPNAGVEFAGGEYKANQVIRAAYFASNSGEWIVYGASYAANITIHNQTAESAAAATDELLLYSTTDSANRKATVATVLSNVNNLTEDTSPDRTSDFTLTYDASAAAAKKVKLSNIPSNLPRGYMDGCILANNAGNTSAGIDVSAGVCRDSTNAVDIIMSALTNKKLDANWVAGSSQGMRNSAASIANGTYHLYAVRTAASAAADLYAFAGVSGTDPDSAAAISTMLTALQAESGGSSYIYARRIGSIVRVSAAIVGFVQMGDNFLWTTPSLDINLVGQASAGSRTLTALRVPLGPKVRAHISAMAKSDTNGSAGNVFFTSPDQTDVTTGQTIQSFMTSTVQPFWNEFFIRTDTSGRIGHRSGGANCTYSVTTLGYHDPRGTNA